MAETSRNLEHLIDREYTAGFVTDVEQDSFPPGLSEEVVRRISAKKGEPAFMLEWRLNAYRHWLTMKEPDWAHVRYAAVDYQSISYFSQPKQDKDRPKSLDESIPSCSRPTTNSACPLRERECWRVWPSMRCSIQRVVGTTFGRNWPSWVSSSARFPKRCASIPSWCRNISGRGADTDNFFASAELGGVLRWLLRLHAQGRALPDGAVHLLPHQRGEHRPVRAHADHRRRRRLRQLSRRLHRADARREPVARGGGGAGRAGQREIKYSTVQNWYPGDENGKGGIYNFVTKRGDVPRRDSQISWTQVETGSAITWKYPSWSCAATTRWASSIRWR
jgi:Fe-S cluster assembly protein SufB